MSTANEHGTAAEKQMLLDVAGTGSINASTNAGRRSAAPTTCGLPRNLANVLTMAVGYLFLFTAFQTTQILASALLGNLGSISVTVLYIVFVAAGFCAPAIARALAEVNFGGVPAGPKLGLFCGGLTYCLFMASLVYMIAPMVLLASGIIGFGAAVLWTSQGMMISQCTNDANKATYGALFWGIFNLCVIPGNVVSHFLLKSKHHSGDGSDDGSAAADHISNHTAGGAGSGGIKMVYGWNDQNSPLFIFLFFSGLLGLCVMLLLRKPDANNGSPAEVEKRPVLQQVKATFGLMLEPRMVCILPLFFFSGVEMTMWSAWFTRQMYATVIGLVMVGFGISEFVGCFAIGPIGDKYGRAVLLALGTVFWVAAAGLTWSGNDKVHSFCANIPCVDGGYGCPCEKADYTYFFVAAVLYGLADCCFQVTATADFVVAGQSSDAFALYRTLQSLGGVIGFGISPLLEDRKALRDLRLGECDSLCARITAGIDGGKTSDPRQLQLEIAMTAGCCLAALMGFAVYSATKIPRNVSTDLAASPVGAMYSQAVVAGGMVYCAGQIGLLPGQELVPSTMLPPTVEEQTRLACQNLVAVLRAGGCEPRDVVKTTVFLTDLKDFQAMNKVYKQYLGRKSKGDSEAVALKVAGEAFLMPDEPPARSAVVVKTLPGKALVEIEAMAEIPRYPQFASQVVACSSFC